MNGFEEATPKAKPHDTMGRTYTDKSNTKHRIQNTPTIMYARFKKIEASHMKTRIPQELGGYPARPDVMLIASVEVWTGFRANGLVRKR